MLLRYYTDLFHGFGLYTFLLYRLFGTKFCDRNNRNAPHQVIFAHKAFFLSGRCITCSASDTRLDKIRFNTRDSVLEISLHTIFKIRVNYTLGTMVFGHSVEKDTRVNCTIYGSHVNKIFYAFFRQILHSPYPPPAKSYYPPWEIVSFLQNPYHSKRQFSLQYVEKS